MGRLRYGEVNNVPKMVQTNVRRSASTSTDPDNVRLEYLGIRYRIRGDKVQTRCSATVFEAQSLSYIELVGVQVSMSIFGAPPESRPIHDGVRELQAIVQVNRQHRAQKSGRSLLHLEW